MLTTLEPFKRQTQKQHGFTVAEALLASGVLALCTAACLSAIGFDQVCIRKAKEEAIVMDFLAHYTETLKALPFESIGVGMPINYLFDGAHSGPNLPIPASGAWVALDSNAYQTFHPDLVWLSNRKPQMQVTLAQTKMGTVLHHIQINIKVDWDPPMGRGQRMEVQTDLLRSKDVTTL
jgi:hypothetical protein